MVSFVVPHYFFYFYCCSRLKTATTKRNTKKNVKHLVWRLEDVPQ